MKTEKPNLRWNDNFKQDIDKAGWRVPTPIKGR